MRLLFSLAALAVCVALQSQSILRIHTPQLTPLFDTLYVCGPHNGWNPASATDQLTMVENGVYEYKVPPTQQAHFEFLITRGSFDRKEVDAKGDSIAPHRISTTLGETEIHLVQCWSDLKGEHTVTAHVRLLASRFPSPTGARRIWLCLPASYSSTTTARYKTWYVQDGQNIFDHATSFAGEWKWDEAMLNHCSESIIVGIDNAGNQRLDEYAPFENEQYQKGGRANAYLDWLTTALMPFVEKHFRTLPGAENTTIAGSSMGALVAVWAVLNYPQFFGTAVAMSPALWFNADEVLRFVEQEPLPSNVQLFMMAGVSESQHMITDMSDLRSALLARGLLPEQIALYTDAQGVHSESAWSTQLTDALGWVDACYVPTHSALPLPDMYVWPNPVRSILNVALPDHSPIRKWAIRNNEQREVANNPAVNNYYTTVDCTALIPGAYQLLVVGENGRQYLLNIVKE